MALINPGLIPSTHMWLTISVSGPRESIALSWPLKVLNVHSTQPIPQTIFFKVEEKRCFLFCFVLKNKGKAVVSFHLLSLTIHKTKHGYHPHYPPLRAITVVWQTGSLNPRPQDLS